MIPLRRAGWLCVLWLVGAVGARAELDSFDGAWRSSRDGMEQVLLVADGYWSCAVFNRDQKQFVATFGGPYVREGEVAKSKIHFDSQDPQKVGEPTELQVERSGDELIVRHEDGEEERWQRIEQPADPLNGVWRITSRVVEGKPQEMPLRARRTLKILAGGRFQWIAMNIETGEFSGTGGGTYRFEDGRYIETLEFFSRDSSRVGAKLEFEARVEDGKWHHRGRSSKGDPIYEIWSPLEPEA